MGELTKSEENLLFAPKGQDLQDNFYSALQVVDDIVLKSYITQLQDLEVIPLDKETRERNIVENVRFFKITEMVYEKDEYSTYKFASVFNALSTLNCAVFIIIDSDGEKADFYMGIRSIDSNRTTSSLKNTLQNAMSGQFPGIKTIDYLDEDMEAVIGGMKANSISVVSSVANSKDGENRSNKSFIQGLEKLALSMQGEKYTAVILANGTPQSQLSEIRKGYETIYTQLSSFANTQISYSTNSSVSLSEAITYGTSYGTSPSMNSSSTYGETSTSGAGTSESYSRDNTMGRIAKGVAIAAGVVASAGLIIGTGGVAIPGIAAATASTIGLGAAATGGIASSVAVGTHRTETHGVSINTSESINSSKTEGETNTTNENVNDSSTNTKGLQTGESKNLTMTLTNKSIVNILDRLDTQLERLQEFESLGMWECAAYFMSENPYAAEIAASTYKALMRGENSGVEMSAINSWSKQYDKVKAENIHEYITNFIHPIFQYQNSVGIIPVTPCSLVSGNELALHMGLPRRSVCGFPVIEHADFGKEVVSYSGTKATHTINLGKVFNMGSECANSVRLNRNSLTMHTFITGSTGAGKSNTIYEILRQLNAVNIKFMVVEPAKGEYKNVFGNRWDVTVLGTNPDYSRLLKINPFKFPNKVHVLEHIDRLIEIFNVCWPMYAAMPVILKDAVLQAYEVCGWDMIESKNRLSDGLFPTFSDLQNELISVIESSAYSQELKSNYMGSLVTRVKSLTNGLNGQIFSSEEIDNKLLFDENVIVDLSRIGSLETKSLIMGILVMRLTEYRISEANGMNVPLKHVTVLEEAHNILKRTSTEQNPEAPSVSGKSVEMLSNAIAEMRTYGEGFIIADQSPSAVDISAIRNTNTKIIMRSPDELDRRLAGKSAALKDEQLDEIAKLPCGVAVVYQNDWLEPVLCKIKEFDTDESLYEYERSLFAKSDIKRLKKEVLLLLLKGRTVEQIEPNIDFISDNLDKSDFATKNKIGIYSLVEEYKIDSKLRVWNDSYFKELAAMVTELLNNKAMIKSVVQVEKNYEELNKYFFKLIDTTIPELTDEIKITICQCFMKEYAGNDSEKLEIYSAWREITCKGGEVL